MPVHRWAGAFWLLIVAAWLFLEYQKGPALMERFRQMPAMREGHPLPASRREEALYWLWRLQCVGTLVYLVIRWLTSGVDRGGRNVERVIVMCNQWLLAAFGT